MSNGRERTKAASSVNGVKMFKYARRLSLSALVLAAALPAAARSSLGLGRIEASVGLFGDDTRSIGNFRLSGDFRITDAHGLQFDVLASDYTQGFLGQIDAHLYLMPTERAKYGFFASLADVDGREATIAYAGAEGLWALSDATFLGARAGLGYARPASLDFIALDARIDHALSSEFGIFASASLAEIQEEALDTLPWGVELGMTWQASHAPFEITAALGSTGLAGRDDAASEGYARVALTWRFGAGSGARRAVADRSFSAPAPFDPLLRRGRF